jgi:uncharacterized protein YecE (DUF72 family)
MTLNAAEKLRLNANGPRIGTAGWSLPAGLRDQFPPGDSVLARYGQGLDAVEINSSFYRPHRRETYERWAASTPAKFRFAVKAPRTITHERRLMEVDALLERFLGEIGGLGGKLGPVLIQSPPSLRFEVRLAETFLRCWRARFGGDTALEPRHSSWFTPEAEALLIEHRVARVAADPAPVAAAGAAGGWDGFQYHRLHGSPEIYVSPYDDAAIDRLAATLPARAWAVFDNTKFGAATENALRLRRLTGPGADLASEADDEPGHAR